LSVIRLLISGLLVASGLTLGAFTLYGAFDARPTQASGLKPWATTTSPHKTAPGTAATDAKETKKKRRAEKRPAEPTQKTKQPPQQAAAEWPWSWFGN
jgi:hypothetical protein